LSVTVHVTVPLNATPVLRLTPGPTRWKSWLDERSRTVIAYLPASSVETAFPAGLRREIV